MEHAVKLNVDGESQLVTLTEMVHPIHCMFHAMFEDGYENIFFTDVETGHWIEQDVGATAMADMIGRKIIHLYDINQVNKCVIWHAEHDETGKLIEFGYCRDTSGGYLVYEIFSSNRRYMFTLVRLQNHVWQLFKIPGSGWGYDQAYIQKVPFILEEIGQF
jgi:hypothetical protein